MLKILQISFFLLLCHAVSSNAMNLVDPDDPNSEITRSLCRGVDSSAVKYVVMGAPGPNTVTWLLEGAATNLGTASLANDIDSINITGLTATDSYVVIIEDAMGNVRCQDTIAFNTTGSFGVTGVGTDPSCFGDNNGSASAIVEIGGLTVNDPQVQGYSFQWDNGDINQMTTGLSAGAYNVLVTSPEGCTATDFVNLTDPGQLVVDPPTITLPTCAGGTDAIIELNITGGTPSSGATPYTIQWSTGPADINRNPLDNTSNPIGEGMYSVTVSDANVCQVMIADIVVADPMNVSIDGFINLQPTTCSRGICDGQVEVQISGGTNPGAGYTFLWDNGETVATPSMLCAGTRTVEVSNNGCPPVTSTIDIISPNDVSVSVVDSSNLSCFGVADGSVQVLANGGTPAYTYTWDDGGNGAIRNALNAGTLTVVAFDDNGCTSLPYAVTLIEPDSLELVVDLGGTLDPRCSDTENGILAVRWIRGGNMGTTPSYSWSANTPNPPNMPIATNLPAGTYGVTVTDGRGCQDSTTHTLTSPPPLLGQMMTPEEPNCFGELTLIRVDTALGGTGNTFTFSVNNGPQRPLGMDSEVLAGTHLVSVFDRNACRWDTTIVINQPDQVTVNIVDEISVNLGDSVQLMPNVPNSIMIDSIIWTPPGNLTCTDCLMPWVIPSQSALYQIDVVDVNGCRGTDQVLINLNRARNVYIPNAFSPNGDGINDFFQLSTGLGVNRVVSLRVFDRWGSMLYEQENYLPGGGTDGWNGQFKGRNLNMATYVYVADIEFLDATVLTFRGSVNLIR